MKESQKALREGSDSIEALVRKKLTHFGIQGNAVIPNTEESPEWEEFKRETSSKYERELNRLKEGI